ncbi:hypothetical protein ACP275_11G110800 [Erythranthe tilingii]
MAEEAANSEVQAPSAGQNPVSVEATIESGGGGGATESTCNNNNGSSNSAGSSEAIQNDELEKSLDYADELMARGSKAAKERDYAEATDCYSRALEIRVAHFGELAPECVNAYYKFGCALLYKAQEETDPFGAMPKKDAVSQEGSTKGGSVKITETGESSAASVSDNAEKSEATNCSDNTPDETVEGKGEEGDEESDAEELADGEEDESDLDLAWKMLDVARAIVEKLSDDTMEKVDILSALAEVALEREDVETSLSDYLKALSILTRLVEPDSRLIAELNFRICLCLEIGSKPEEAIPYCENAVSVCKSRVQRLSDEVKNLSGEPLAEKEAEIETLTGLSGELEKKLEDLQQLVLNPKSILADILGIMSAKAKANEKTTESVGMSSSRMGIAGTAGSTDSPTVSTAHTNGASAVTHLGVVGRGVKRVVMSSTTQSSPSKKPSVDPSSNHGDGSTS